MVRKTSLPIIIFGAITVFCATIYVLTGINLLKGGDNGERWITLIGLDLVSFLIYVFVEEEGDN